MAPCSSSSDSGVRPAATGRPAYHPSTLLKIYLYGYLNRVQSSRRLEREALRHQQVGQLGEAGVRHARQLPGAHRVPGPRHQHHQAAGQVDAFAGRPGLPLRIDEAALGVGQLHAPAVGLHRAYGAFEGRLGLAGAEALVLHLPGAGGEGKCGAGYGEGAEGGRRGHRSAGYGARPCPVPFVAPS